MIHENDEKAVLDLASTIKEIFANNLAENAKIEASHVRGNSRRFSASRVVDGKKVLTGLLMTVFVQLP